MNKIKKFFYKLFKIPYIDEFKFYPYAKWKGEFTQPTIPYLKNVDTMK